MADSRGRDEVGAEADEPPRTSTAVRVASAAGLFGLGLVLVPLLLIAGAYLLDAVGVTDGSTALVTLFLVVGVLAIGLTAVRRVRPLGIGATLALVVCGLLAVFYFVVLQAGEF